MKSTMKLVKKSYDYINMLLLAFFVFCQTSIIHAVEFNTDNMTGDANSDLSDVASNIDNSMVIVFNTIKTVGVVAGLIFVFAGIVSLKKSQDQGANVSPFKGAFLILIGGMCGVLPFIFLTASATMGGTGGTTTP